MGMTRSGRKRVFPHQKMLEALDYCIAYCDDQDDCSDCMFRDVKIGVEEFADSHCSIYVITALRDAVIERADEHDERYNRKRYTFAKD